MGAVRACRGAAVPLGSCCPRYKPGGFCARTGNPVRHSSVFAVIGRSAVRVVGLRARCAAFSEVLTHVPKYKAEKKTPRTRQSDFGN